MHRRRLISTIVHALLCALLVAGCATAPKTTSEAVIPIDRSQMPIGGPEPTFVPPVADETVLPNGLRLVVVPSTRVPMFHGALIMPGGTSMDGDGKIGLAHLTALMISEGTTSRTSLEIADRLEFLASSLYAGSTVDSTNVQFSGLSTNFDETLSILADIVLNPTFEQKQFDRVRTQHRTRIQQLDDNPYDIANRVFRWLAWDRQFLGRLQATPETIDAVTRQDIMDFHQVWYRPSGATLLVVGSVPFEEVRTAVETHLGAWSGSPPVISQMGIPVAEPRTEIFLVDRPGASQSTIMLGHIAFGWESPASIESFEIANRAVGGYFMSRLNLKLREEKAYTYGARSAHIAYINSGEWRMSTQVRADATADALADALELLGASVGDQKLTIDEFENARRNAVQGFPQRFETQAGVSSSFSYLIGRNRPLNSFLTEYQELRALTHDAVTASWARWLQPDRFTVVVVGDRAAVEEALVEKLGRSVVLVDVRGNAVQSP